MPTMRATRFSARVALDGMTKRPIKKIRSAERIAIYNMLSLRQPVCNIAAMDARHAVQRVWQVGEADRRITHGYRLAMAPCLGCSTATSCEQRCLKNETLFSLRIIGAVCFCGSGGSFGGGLSQQDAARHDEPKIAVWHECERDMSSAALQYLSGLSYQYSH